ncbi:hypothetical protein AVEN_36439-1, partial [Araneus ventricosus]
MVGVLLDRENGLCEYCAAGLWRRMYNALAELLRGIVYNARVVLWQWVMHVNAVLWQWVMHVNAVLRQWVMHVNAVLRQWV